MFPVALAGLVLACSQTAWAESSVPGPPPSQIPSPAPPQSPPTYSCRIGGPGIEVVGWVEGKERVTASVLLPGMAYDLLQVGDVLYVARGFLGVTAIDVSDAEHPTKLFTFATGEDVAALFLSGKTLLAPLRDGSAELVFDVSHPLRPALLRKNRMMNLNDDPRRIVWGAVLLVVSAPALGSGGYLIGLGATNPRDSFSVVAYGAGGFIGGVGVVLAITGAALLGTGIRRRKNPLPYYRADVRQRAFSAPPPPSPTPPAPPRFP